MIDIFIYYIWNNFKKYSVFKLQNKFIKKLVHFLRLITFLFLFFLQVEESSESSIKLIFSNYFSKISVFSTFFAIVFGKEFNKPFTL